MEFIDVVNENDEVIGNAPRDEIYDKRLLHRIVHIFLFNDNGDIALQLQSKHKKFCPFYWSSSAAGHVKSGETSEEAAIRELEEEIGVKTKIDFIYKDIYEYKNSVRVGLKKLLITFKSKFNGPFKINPWEVEKVEFFTLEKIQQMVNNGEKFHPELLFLLKRHFGIK